MFNELIEEITSELEKKEGFNNEELDSSLEQLQAEKKIELKSSIEEIKNSLQLVNENDLVNKIKMEYQIKLMEEQLDVLTTSKTEEFIMNKLEKINRENKLVLIEKIGDVLYDKKQELTDLVSNKEQELEVMKQKLYNEVVGLNSQNVVLNTTAKINELSNYVSYNRELLNKINKLYEDNLYGLNRLDISPVTSADLDTILSSYRKTLVQFKEYKKVNMGVGVKVNKKQQRDKKVIKVKARIKNNGFDTEKTKVQKLIADAVLNSNSSYLTQAEQLLEKSSLDDKIKSKLNSKIVETKNKLDIKDADESFAKIREKVNSGSYDKQEMLKEIEKLKKMYDVISGVSSISDVKKKEYKNILNKIIFKYNKDSQDSLQYKISATEDMVNAFPKTSLKEIVKLSTKCLFGKLRKNKNIDFTNTPMVLIKKNYISKKKFGILNNRLSYEEEKKYDDAKKVISKNLVKGIKKSKIYDKQLCDKFIELIKTMPEYVSYRRKEYTESYVLKNARDCFEEALVNGNITEEEYNNYINLSNDICLYRNNMRNCYELSENSNVISYVDMDLRNLMEMKQKLNSN